MTTISPDLGANYQPPAVPCRGCDRPLYVALTSRETAATALRWCESCSRTGEAEPDPERRPRGTKGRRMSCAELGIGESVMAPAEVIEERRRRAREREEAAMPQGTPMTAAARRDIERRVSASEDHEAIARRYGIEATTVRKIAREERKARGEPAPVVPRVMPQPASVEATEPTPPTAPAPAFFGPKNVHIVDDAGDCVAWCGQCRFEEGARESSGASSEQPPSPSPSLEPAPPDPEPAMLVQEAEPSQAAAWVVGKTTEHPIAPLPAPEPLLTETVTTSAQIRIDPRRPQGPRKRAKKQAPASNARRERIFAAALAGVVEVAAREREEREEEFAIQVGISALTLRLRLLQVRRLLRAGRVEEAGEMLGVRRG